MKPAAAETNLQSYVTLGVGNDVFAVDVRYVREILDIMPIAALPHAPPFLVGMIDVRGSTVPVVDLKRKLGMAAATATEQQRILVLEVPLAARTLVLGLLCDRVFEVAEFGAKGLEAAPELGVRWNSDYIKAIGRWRGAFVIIFDMEKLFSTAEFPLFEGGR